MRIVLLGVAIDVLAAWLLPGALQRIGVCFAGVALFARSPCVAPGHPIV